MAIALGKIRRIKTPSGMRCIKKFKTGKVRFVSCDLKGTGGLQRHKKKKGGKRKSKSHKKSKKR